jgi:hypothetical protein
LVALRKPKTRAARCHCRSSACRRSGIIWPGSNWRQSPPPRALRPGDPDQLPRPGPAALNDGWYRTGDLGRRDTGGYYYIVDRTKDMIITGGENVYSVEVERAPAARLAALVFDQAAPPLTAIPSSPELAKVSCTQDAIRPSHGRRARKDRLLPQLSILNAHRAGASTDQRLSRS